MKVSKSIWDTRFTRAKPPMALDAAVVDALFALDDWITIHGAHVEIDGDGNVLHGAGGKFNGTNYYRHMNEKARAEKGEIHNDFNKAEYSAKLEKAIAENEAAAEKDVLAHRKKELAKAEETLAQAREDYQKARERGLTRRGLVKYENRIRNAEDAADSFRTPEQLREKAQAERDRGGFNNSEWYEHLANIAEDDIENATRERLTQRIKENSDIFKGKEFYGIPSGGGKDKRATALSIFTEGNTRNAQKIRESELIEKRANTRIEQLRESGQYPKEVGLYAETDGSIRLDPGTGAAGVVLETPDQVKQGIKDYGKQPDAAGQKSIFGGSGWW